MDVYCKNHRACVVQLYFDCKCLFANIFSSFPQQPRYSLRSRKSLCSSEVSRVKDWCWSGKGLIDISRSDLVVSRDAGSSERTELFWKVSERSERSRMFHPFLMYVAFSCCVFTYPINKFQCNNLIICRFNCCSPLLRVWQVNCLSDFVSKTDI